MTFFREAKFSVRAALLFAAVPALFSAACASTSFSRPEAVVIPEDFIGISPDRTELKEEYAAKLDELGAVWIRTSIRWETVEREEGAWDFSYWDEYVNRACAAGKKIVFILCFDNPWLYEDRREHRDLTGREIPYFLKYVEQVVTRYRGRAGAYEIWNEPNGFFWYGSDEHFFALSAAAAKKIKEIDPGTPVLAGSFFRVAPGFIRGMFEAGAFEHTDGISFHPYSSDALHTIKQTDKLKKLMAEYGYEKPIWITEAGYATGGIYFSFCNLDNYPEYIIKTLSGLAVRGTRNVIWYELMDEYDPGRARNGWWPGQFFGLMYPNGTLKNGARAFRLWSAHIPGSEYRPELPLRDGVHPSVVSLYFRKKNEHILLLWRETPGRDAAPRNVFLTVPGAPSLKKYSIVTGEAEETGTKTALAVGTEPVFLVWTTEEGFNGAGPSLSGTVPRR